MSERGRSALALTEGMLGMSASHAAAAALAAASVQESEETRATTRKENNTGMATREKSSKVWLYFSSVEKERAKCSKCDAILTCKGGCTSALRKHLLAVHKIRLSECTVFESLRKKAPAVPVPEPDTQLVDEEEEEDDDAVSVSSG